MALSSPQVRFSGPHQPQQWSLPDNNIYYITTNPLSAKVYQKLTKTCKYFYSKNPITVCAELNSNSEENEKDEDKEFLLWLEQNTYDFNCRWEDGIRKFIDLNTIPDKLWITDDIEIFVTDLTEKQNLISFIFPKIYRCDIKLLCLQDQNISFSQFLFLSSNVESLDFGNVIVKNEDDNVVSLEKLVETAVKIQTLKFYPNPPVSSISTETAKNLLKIPHFLTLKRCRLDWMPEIFDIDTIFNYIKKNKITDFDLGFYKTISQAYKDHLTVIVDEIINAESHDYKPPSIRFDGLDAKKSRKLLALYNKNLQKH